MPLAHPSTDQSLIPQPEVCKMLGQTRSGIDKLKKKDPTFPKPIKFSKSRQAACYYVRSEVQTWLRAKIDARDAQ
ncbi:AlpA family phage regulatory protein [Pseudomonas luteola]